MAKDCSKLFIENNEKKQILLKDYLIVMKWKNTNDVHKTEPVRCNKNMNCI